MDMQQAFDRGDFLAVVESADKAGSPEEKLLVGISLFKLGKLSEAMEVLREVSDTARELARAFFFMAQIHMERGETESAQFCIDQYIPFYPDDDEALDILQSGQQLPPLISEPSLELAKLYAAQGHFKEALDIYVDLLKTSMSDPEVRKEARRVQAMYIIKTLEGWLEKMPK